MSVYAGPMFPTPTSRIWRHTEACHLVGDTETELVTFALGIGLKAEWLQRGHCTHFDLSRNKRQQAVAAGAVEVNNRELVAWMRRKRAERARERELVEKARVGLDKARAEVRRARKALNRQEELEENANRN